MSIWYVWTKCSVLLYILKTEKFKIKIQWQFKIISFYNPFLLSFYTLIKIAVYLAWEILTQFKWKFLDNILMHAYKQTY